MRLLRRFACAIVTLPSLLAAQQHPDTITLKPVVVTATRIPTPATELPVAVTVIERAQLLAQGLRTVGDALRTVPGANIVTTDAYGSVTSLFLRGGESDYVKVLIDGVAQNTPGGGYDFANLTTENVERIEVVPGPVSVLYGSDAVTGVVQIFTRDGRGAPQGEVTFEGGTYGTSGLDATLAAGDRGAGYAVGVARFASDGIYPMNNHYRNEVVTGRVRIRPEEHTDAALAFRYADALYHFPTDAYGDVVSNNQHQLDRGPSVALDLGHLFSSVVDAHLSAGWHRDNYQYAIAPNSATDTTTFPYSSSDWVTREDLEGRANLRLAGSDVLTVGGAFDREAMDGTTLGGPRSRNDGGVYLQLVTRRLHRANITLGARLEDNQLFGTFATYRSGVSLELPAATRAIAAVGTGFKEPTLYQNYATGFVRGNPALRPERSFSWEVGLEHTIPRSGVTLRATYFDQRFRNLIDYNGTDTLVNYFNVPGADARGVEVTSDAAFGGRMQTAVSYTFLDTRVTQSGVNTGGSGQFLLGLPLIRRPRHTASVVLTYRLATRGSAGLTALYTGDRADLNFRTSQRVTLPSYTRVDLSGDLDLLEPRGALPGLALLARVENLFDRAYDEIENFPARRRSLLFGGRMRFGS